MHDEPWEGTASGYHNIFRNGDRYRMYYQSIHIDFPGGELRTDSHPRFCRYAESSDGIFWTRPELVLYKFNGSKVNNIVLTSETMNGVAIDAGNPAVLRDRNPDAPTRARYKAILKSSEKNGLIVLASADGIRWSPYFDHLILRLKGAFDSQNLAFWDGSHFKRWNQAFLRPGPERPGTSHYGSPAIA